MRPEVELLSRHQARVFEDGARWLVVDAPDVETVRRFEPSRVDHWIRDHRVARGLTTAVSVARSMRWMPPPGTFDRALIFLPKGRRLQRMTFAAARTAVGDGAPVYVVGANKAGIKGARTALTEMVGPSLSIDAAKKCTLLRADAKVEAAAYVPDAWAQRWTATLGDRQLAVQTWPGTFSDGELDVGSAELLTALGDRAIEGAVLDLGCGAGVLGGMAALRGARVTLVDVHAAAVASTESMIAQNDLAQAQCRPSDWYSDVDGAFDVILCNPPFHDGVETNVTMIDGVLRDSARHLTGGGELWLVANRFLPYQDALEAAFGHVEVVRDTNRFRVYRCRGPRRAHAMKAQGHRR